MSILDRVTVEYPIEGISHETESYETKSMVGFGEYLVDKKGQLHRREYPGDYQLDSFTGSFDMVGNENGYWVLEFDNGLLREWERYSGAMIYVLAIVNQHHEDPTEFDVLGVYTSLERAKEEVTVGEWTKDYNSEYSDWSNSQNNTKWLITPRALVISGAVSDGG